MEKRTTLSKQLKAKYDQIRRECGAEGNFRFALGYLMDKGFSYTLDITEEDIQEMVDKLNQEEKKDGSFFIMTPEFQGEIVRNAVKLAKVSNWCNLLKYITNEVYMDETY